MIGIRRAADRGHFDHGWLDTFHTFSFADYHDPRFMGFRTLRVINDDRVQPGREFGMHGHRDMEIVTWVLSGSLEHRDNLGNGSIIRPGECQRMTAGTGVMHSERNPSRDEPVHLLQIWILPERRGLPPGYEQQAFPEAARRGRLALLASRDGHDGSVTIHQDASVHTALLGAGQSVRHVLGKGRSAWVQVASGELSLEAAGAGANGADGRVELHAGDGVALAPEGDAAVALALTGGAGSARGASPGSAAEVLVFDLA